MHRPFKATVALAAVNGDRTPLQLAGQVRTHQGAPDPFEPFRDVRATKPTSTRCRPRGTLTSVEAPLIDA